VLAFMAAALAASTSAPVLEPSVPWFERIVITFDGQGAQKSCTYKFSLAPGAAEACDKDMASSIKPRSKGPNGVFSKLTFERRFSPGGKLDSGKLQLGDELLGQQVLFLTINPDGELQSCKVLATSGEFLPAYDCDSAKTEQFRAAASPTAQGPRQAFMTVLVYGHQEHIA